MEKSDTDFFAEFMPVSPEAWKAQILKDIKAASEAEKQRVYEQKMIWQLYEGIAVNPFYALQDGQALPVAQLRKHNRGWQTQEWISATDAVMANGLAKEALHTGADALAFFIPDFSSVHIDQLLNDIPDTTPVVLHIDQLPEVGWNVLSNIISPYPNIVLAHDPIALYAQKGRDFGTAFNQLAAITRQTPSDLRVVSVSSRVFHEAGASATQELACVMGSLVEYVHQLTDRGVSAKEVLAKVAVLVSINTSYFMEIAKIRALRILLNQVALAYGVTGLSFPVTGMTADWNKPDNVPYENSIRATIECMAGIIGGCDALIIRIPGPASDANRLRRLARNITVILREESFFGEVADMAVGSYYIDILTRQLAEEAWQQFKQIEKQGGILESIKSGFIQKEINSVRMQREADIQEGRQIVVGVNKYAFGEVSALNEAFFQKLHRST